MANLYDAFATGAYLKSTNGFANSLIVSNTKGLFYGALVFNSGGSTVYVHVYDSATLPANGTLPITGATCYAIFPVAAAATQAILGPMMGEGVYNNGIVVAISTSGTNLTISTANTSFISARYGLRP